jgi:hypothetical protein
MRREIFYHCIDPTLVYWTDGKEPPARGGSLEEMLALPRKELEKLRVIAGHMPFGLRERLPWPETWHYVTFVRNPLTRTLSEYYQVRGDTSNPAHAAGWQYTLEEFVRRQYGLSSNGMCRMLSNECYGKMFANPEAMYQEAVRNAESCSFVGVLECYRESVRRLCQLCGWREPVIAPQHCCTPNGRTLTENERRVILDHNVLDQALYHQLSDRFWSQQKEAEAITHAITC